MRNTVVYSTFPTRSAFLKKAFASLLVAAFLVAPSIAGAEGSFGSPANPMPSGLSSCFDYYTFGAVRAQLTPSLMSVAQDASLHFTGTITNGNNYPVADMTVWGKVFRERSTEKDINAPDVLAWVKIADHITLSAKGSMPVSYDWQVPVTAEPGSYQLATYVTSSDRFELSGLTFTDDVTGSVAHFTVEGNDTGAVRFDKDAVTVLGKPYHFAAFPPDATALDTYVPITASISNSTNEPFKGTVTWKLYRWDAITTDAMGSTLISQQSDDVKVHPQSSTTVSYTVKNTDYAVYYVVGELQAEKASAPESIIGIRYVRDEVQTPRFNFVTAAPAKNGSGNVAVACFHSTNQTMVTDGHVEVVAYRGGLFFSLLSSLGIGKIANASYNGDITPEISALVTPISSDASSYVLKATLYKAKTKIDDVTTQYCAKGSCRDYAPLIMLIGGLLVVLALLVLLRMNRRASRGPVINSYPS